MEEQRNLPRIADILNDQDYKHMTQEEQRETFQRAVEQVIDVPFKEPALDAERTVSYVTLETGETLPRVPSMRILRAYQDYFDLGSSRTIAELCRRYRKTAELYGRQSVPTISAPVLYRWKKAYDWEIQARADELDLYEQSRATRKEGARKMVERQTGYARVAQTIGYNFLRALLDEHGNLTEEGKRHLTPSEARRLILDGSKLEMDLFGGGKELIEDEEEISYA